MAKSFMLRFLSIACTFFGLGAMTMAQENDPLVIPENATWQDLVNGDAAIALAEKHPLRAECKALEGILLPAKGTRRETVEEVYGDHRKVLPSNPKQPAELHEYAPLKGATMQVHYESGRAVSSEFHFDDAKFHPVSRRIGAPRYSDLLHDLELKHRLMGQLLVKIKRTSTTMPWIHSTRKLQ